MAEFIEKIIKSLKKTLLVIIKHDQKVQLHVAKPMWKTSNGTRIWCQNKFILFKGTYFSKDTTISIFKIKYLSVYFYEYLDYQGNFCGKH